MRRTVLAISIALAMVVLAFTARSIVRHGEVLPGVTAGPIELGGLGPDAARAALEDYSAQLAENQHAVAIDGTSFQFFGGQVGFELDIDAALELALEAGRGSPFEQFRDWLTRRNYHVRLDSSVDPAAVDSLIATWEDDAVARPPTNGEITYQDGAIHVVYPQPGRAVSRDGSAELMNALVIGALEDPGVLRTEEVPPSTTIEMIEAAAEQARELTRAPITLTAPPPVISVTLTADDIGQAIATAISEDPPAAAIILEPEALETALAPVWIALQGPPRDAQIVVGPDDQVIVVPGEPGTVVDLDALAREVVRASQTTHRTGSFTFTAGAEPEFTTEDAIALNVTGLVSDFTTFHRCCEPRVQNIQRMADLVDGTLVLPGEEFSLNEHVGPRTIEKGFVEAPMILRGEFVPSVGGGISQFATTLYNAVFFGGYEDVTHQPHSYYFSRYPEGREATVSFPRPELIFRNDTANGLIIKTEYTDESITVKLFGNNEGRQVEDGLSPRRNFRDPPTDYEPDSSLDPEDEIVESRGTQGWTVTVTRTITFADGTSRVEEFDWAYQPQPRVVRVHPCRIPGATTTCPTTTTTSSTTTTTTTTTTSTTTTLP